MTLDYLKILLALLLVWPRGYLLIYLIDRSKSMSFGFKFFVGWLLGLAGFTIDAFAMNIFNHFSFGYLVFAASSLSQIFGFGFMIFIFEKKLPLPNFKNFIPFLKEHLGGFLTWPIWEKVLMIFLLSTLILRLVGSVWTITNIPTYEFDSWNNWNLRAKVIYEQKEVPLDKESQFYLGGGIKSYPLHDAMLKVWIASAVGEFKDKYINLTSVIYYLFLLAIFYFSLPKNMDRAIKILATYALSSLPLLFVHSSVAYADLLYSVYLYLAIISLFYFLAGAGNSFYYLSGMGLAFGVWTKNEALTLLFPVLVFTTLALVIIKKVKLKDFFLSWFFAVLTIASWLGFRIIQKLDFLSGDSSTFNLVYNNEFVSELFSTVFLRSHFNILWTLFFAVIIFKFKDIWASLSLKYLASTIIVLFILSNSIILFTDKALDLSAAARVNLQLAPLAVAFLAFSAQKFFGKIK